MRGYVTKRLLIAVVTLVGMSVVIFVLMRLAPGNIADIIFESAGYVDEADRKRLEAELGIDKPVGVQYARWLADFARGELGKSYRYDLPAWEIIKPRLPVTLELAALALGFSVIRDVVYEMRFDKGSAVYGEFGEFYVFLRFAPEALGETLRL